MDTNKQLAERLKALADFLAQNGDSQADATLSEAVAAVEQAAPLPKRGFGCSESRGGADSNINSGISTDLSTVVEGVKSTTSLGQPLSERFRGLVAQHDKTRCIAAIVFEDIWNGSAGWKPPKVLWDMVVYVWRNAPDFFGDYDPDLEIKECSSEWTQRYFDDQRNSLRFNFCLRRLCHLVMVYEHLHGAKARVHHEEARRPAKNDVPQPCVTTTSSRIGHSSWRGAMVIVPVILLLGTSMYLLGRCNSGDRETQTSSECDWQRAEPCAVGTRHMHEANGVSSEKELPENPQRPLIAKGASQPKIQMKPQMAQVTNASLHSQGQMNRQLAEDTNSVSRLSGRRKPLTPQGTRADAILAEQDDPVERAPVKRAKGAGSR